MTSLKTRPLRVHCWAKMVKYHNCLKFVGEKHCFGTRVYETRVPHKFLHCGTTEVEIGAFI